MSITLVAGLGNPGTKYHDTRHNVGFVVLDHILQDNGASYQSEKKWEAHCFQSEGVLYAKPQTYMNECGRSIYRICSYRQIEPSEILVICDDASLPLGAIRIRKGGSSGGQNGLKSIEHSIKTQDFARLRIGIGRGNEEIPSQNQNLSKHVLGKFLEKERSVLEEVIQRAIESIRVCINDGLDPAMTQYNQRGQGKN